MGSKTLPVLTVLIVLGLGVYALVTALAPVPTPDEEPARPAAGAPRGGDPTAPGIVPEDGAGDAPEARRTVRGGVVDSEDRPVPFARVSSVGGLSVLADAEGRFALPVAGERDEVRVGAEANGYGEAWTAVRFGGGTEVELPNPLRLTRIAGIVGRVLDPKGDPVQGVRVSYPVGRDPFDTRSVTTDRHGRFHVDDARGPAVTLYVRHREYLPRVLTNVRHTAGDRTEVGEIRLEAGGEIIGRVTDPQGKPVPEVALVAIPESEAEGIDLLALVGMDEEDATLTGEDGRYRIAGLPERAFRLYAFKNGWLVPTRENLVVTIGRPLTVDLVVSRGGSVAGIVTDADGKPIAGAVLRVLYEEDTVESDILDLGARSETKSDDEGRFLLTGLGEQRVTIEIEAEGFVAAERPGVEPGRTGLEIILVRGATIVGTVVVAGTGEPVDGAYVGLPDVDGVSYDLSGEDGGFVLLDVPGGDHVIEAEHDEYVPGRTTLAGLRPGETRDGVRVEVAVGHTLTGRVVRASDGVPVDDAEVEAEGPVEHDAKTAGDGTFTIRGLSPGTYVVRVNAGGAAERTVTGVVVPQEGDLTIGLVPGATIRGVVLDAEGNPMAGRFVVVMDPDQKEEGETVTDARGEFSFTGVPPGPKVVLAVALTIAGGGASGTSVEQAEVTVAAGQEVFVRIGGKTPTKLASVRGRVLDRGKPVTNRSVALVRVDLPPGAGLLAGFRTLPIGKDGTWSTGALPPGRYVVLVGRQALNQFGAAGELFVPEGGEHTSDIHLPGGKLAGRVLDDDGKPQAKIGVALYDPVLLRSPLTELSDLFRLMRGIVATDAEGKFEFENVPPGRWFLVLHHDDWAPTAVPDLEVRDGGGKPIDLTIDRGHEFIVNVRDSDGKPLRGAGLYIYDEGGHWVVGGGEWVPVSGNDGVAAARLGTGRWRVAVQEKNHAVTEFEVDVEGDSEREIALRKGGTLNIVAAGPVAGARVRLFDGNGREIYRRLTEREMMFGRKPWRTGAEGRLSIPNVPPGPVTVRVTAENGRVGTGKLTVEDGESVEVPLRLE